MTLQPVRLDDLDWEQMTAAIRRRIPAESAGIWTLHAPVDPGITLLELFAWLLEQRLYWLDQVPDALVVGVLRLLGIDDPRSARPAATVLQIKPDGDLAVPAGTAFTRNGPDLAFTTDAPVRVLQVSSVTLAVDGRDRTADLTAGDGVPLLPADGRAGTARIDLRMPAPVPARPGEWLSLLLLLETPAGIRPEWHPDAVHGVPPPAQVEWWFQPAPDGPPERFGPDAVQDGTAGLRRSGIVRLRIPDAWRAAPPGDGDQPHGLLLRTGRGTFSAPPRLQRLAVNVVAARHRRPLRPTGGEVEELEAAVRRDWRALPCQHLDLPDTRGRLLGARLRLRERDGCWRSWTATRELAFHGRADRVFTLDRTAGALRFGDGRTGRIPVLYQADQPEPLVRARWEVGGGADGNGGTSQDNWRTLDGPAITASNVVAAEGGQDAETIDHARSRAAASLHEVGRAVTLPDHVTVARTTPGVAVARAHAVLGDHPGHPCAKVPGAVGVYIVPPAPRDEDDWERPDFQPAPRPDPGMRRAVCDRLARARLLGGEIFLRELSYRPVWLRVELAGRPGDARAVRRRLQGGLRRFLDPLVGGDDGTGWPFGEPLRPSALLRVAQRLVGAEAEVTAVAVRAGPGDQGRWEDCQDVAIGGHELVALQDVRVRFGDALAQVEGLR